MRRVIQSLGVAIAVAAGSRLSVGSVFDYADDQSLLAMVASIDGIGGTAAWLVVAAVSAIVIVAALTMSRTVLLVAPAVSVAIAFALGLLISPTVPVAVLPVASIPIGILWHLRAVVPGGARAASVLAAGYVAALSVAPALWCNVWLFAETLSVGAAVAGGYPGSRAGA